MAGKIVQIATSTVTSATAGVSLTGINSDDVYMVSLLNVTPETDGKTIQVQITKSGSVDTTSNYDRGFMEIRSDSSSFQNIGTENSADVGISSLGTAGNESCQGIFYLYNFNSSSEWSFVTLSTVIRNEVGGKCRGAKGGFVHTVASASDGIHFKMSSSTNIATGTFTLYRVVS